MATQTTPSIEELLKKLVNEKFNGKNPEWRQGKWEDITAMCATDNNNWFYHHGNVIYVQSLSNPKEPYCFGCNSKLKVKAQKCSVHYRNTPLMGGGDVRTKHIPYCPKCESEPSDSGFIQE